jgi:hypothetical protein
VVNGDDLSIVLGHWLQTGPITLDVGLGTYDGLTTAELGAIAAHGVTLDVVPEPSSLLMLATLLALGGVWGMGRRWRNRVA